jgi:hypothetical protein
MVSNYSDDIPKSRPLRINYSSVSPPELSFQFIMEEHKRGLENLPLTEENFRNLKQLILDQLILSDSQKRFFVQQIQGDL